MIRVNNLIANDISRCISLTCPHKNTCARSKQIEIDKKKEETFVPISDFGEAMKGGRCDYYWKIKNKRI